MAELFDVLTYDVEKLAGINDISEVYTNVATLTTPSREAGLYKIGLSFTYNLKSSNKSIYVRHRIDGSGWTEFISEPSDKTDDRPVFYAYPKDLTAGVHTLEFEARKEDAGTGQLDIHFLDLFIQRIGVTT